MNYFRCTAELENMSQPCMVKVMYIKSLLEMCILICDQVMC